ncbi:hypothetical protein [Roseovarius indicus]|nr:hypothetical protein [Roseovarius indicus]
MNLPIDYLDNLEPGYEAVVGGILNATLDPMLHVIGNNKPKLSSVI